jgi:hypothetical protein
MSFLDDDVRKALREPFPKEQIGKLPATQKRPELDFVGHAAVTDRLNTVAPDWSYTIDEAKRARYVDENGVEHDGAYWIRGTMTIGGVSRPEYGDGSDPKEAIGNFLRRAAMRFGVAIDLWSREDLQGVSGPGTSGQGANVLPQGRKAGAGEPKAAGRTSSSPESARAGAGARPGTDTPLQPRGEPQEKGAGRSSPVGRGPIGEDSTSGEEQGRPSLPGSPAVSTESPPDTAEGGTSSEEEGAAARSAQAPDVKSPSRRCLHMKGTRTVETPSGGRNEVCVECGVVIDRVEASA